MSPAASPAALSAPNVGTLLPVEVHFDELDAMGLPHNSRYQVLAERAWAAFWYARGFGGANGLESDAFNVVKAFTIAYDAPVSAPGTYAVDLWIGRLGSTSATAGYRVCSPDGPTAYAHGTRTAIRLDPATFLPRRGPTGPATSPARSWRRGSTIPLGDRGYDHDTYRRLIWARGIRPVIARRELRMDPASAFTAGLSSAQSPGSTDSDDSASAGKEETTSTRPSFASPPA